MQLPIIGLGGKKEGASEGKNAVSGIFARGVQTAVRRRQPGDGWLGACAGPLVSHQERGNVVPRVWIHLRKEHRFFFYCMYEAQQQQQQQRWGGFA